MSPNMFLSLLLLLFIGLKLTGYIAWAWWWVLAPLWVPLSLALAVLVVYLICRAFESKESRAVRALREYGEALSRRK